MKVHDRRRRGQGRSRKATAARWRVVVAPALGLTGLLLVHLWAAPALPVVQAQGAEAISPAALAQIEALMREKDSRSGVALKIDSQLLYALRMQRGEAVAEGVSTLETDVRPASDGRVDLDVSGEVGDTLLAELTREGATILASVPEQHSVRIRVGLDRVEAIAELPDVSFVQPKQDAVTGADSGPAPRRTETDVPTSPSARQARVAALLSAALDGGALPQTAGIVPPTGQGSRTTEGDRTHRAFSARGTFHVDGTGVKIGVLSDGVSNLAASQARGDLGPVTVLPGQAGAGDEGTAMLEIVHDVAPGAQLFFATAFNGIASFAQNIRDLRAAGCDIIVDDVFYFVETPFQDGQAPTVVSNTNGGVVIQAVNDVTASGGLYFSSAGNSGNLNDGTAGVWEGDFADGGPTSAPLPAGQLQSFGGQSFEVLTANSGPINLYWSDPLGGSGNDYDLFRLNAAGTAVLASSTNVQNGTRDPYEQVAAGAAGNRIVVVKKAAAAGRFLHLDTNRGRLSLATAGQTHGHAAAAAAFGCAATPAGASFPQAFTGANVIETFSSDGPRRLFFTGDGTAITPGNVSSTGGLVRQKPDITAADGVSVTGVGGFPSPFFGTSAAAPHAAAIAGLLKSANPAFTPAQIRSALTGSAIDIEGPGVDRDSGAGIVDAFAALQALGVPGTANLEIASIDALENPGNGDGGLDAGEGARMQIVLQSTGVAPATAISATLSSSTPGIVVTQPPVSAYPDLPAFTGSGTNVVPFRFTIASNVGCPLTASFTLSVSYTGGPSPKVFTFTVPTGPAPVHIATTLTSSAPPAGPGFTTSAGLQNARLNRNGITSACDTPKAFPGITGAGTRLFQAYAFATCATSVPSCVTVSLASTPAGANPALFSAAYAPSFDPSNLATNYLADPGASNVVGGPISYSFALPGGAQSFAIDVNEVNQGLGVGASYTLDVVGACVGACAPPNQVPVARARNVTVSAGPGCTANASIDDGSFDPDGDPLTITQSPAGPYPLGVTSVLLTVTDPKGATSQATANVTVVDTTGPGVTGAAASPSVLWPPNHKLVDVTVSYGSSDNCSASVCTLSVSSNEPANGTGDGNTASDFAVVDAHHVRLRAERSGNGDGRVYTIAITCTDGAGNATVKTVGVTVPKNQR